MEYYGLTSLLSISGSNGTVFNLTDYLHLFNLDIIISKHDTRSLSSIPVFIINVDGTTNSSKYTESTFKRFKVLRSTDFTKYAIVNDSVLGKVCASQ